MNTRDLLLAAYRYAYALTHNAHDAEDLVQTVWLKLLTAHAEVSSKSLVFTTLRNLFVDQYRHNKLIVFEPYDDEMSHHLTDDLTESLLTSTNMDAAMNKLRFEERESIFLNIVEGYTAQEIASMTNMSRNTILSLIHRGKQKLLKYLSEKDVDLHATR